MKEQASNEPMSTYAGPYTRKRRSPGCMIGAILALIVVIGAAGFLFWRARNGVTLSVGEHPTIIGDGCRGTVSIQAGPANQVTLSGIFPPYTQDSATNTIQLGDDCQDITITVPPVANLEIQTTQDITVTGVSGTMKLNTNGHRITLEQVTLEGNSKLDAHAGSSIQTNNDGGPITFNGKLAPGSSTTVNDDHSSINMTLSADTSCQLDISGWPQQINSNIPGVHMPASTSTDVHASIGNSTSTTRLKLNVDQVVIVLNKAA